MKRDWSAAESKRGACRNCGSHFRVELAHIIGREHDRTPPVAWVNRDWSVSKVYVHPDRVIPLCHDCHQGPNGAHAKRLDLLPLLTLTEQIQAVADAGSISQAYTLLMPSESPKRLGRAA